MQKVCKYCGDKFKVPQDTIELLEEGYISHSDISDLCDECSEDSPADYTDYSDADPGL
jgi:hypothetical protein